MDSDVSQTQENAANHVHSVELTRLGILLIVSRQGLEPRTR
jgi:hypothetical protein